MIRARGVNEEGARDACASNFQIAQQQGGSDVAVAELMGAGEGAAVGGTKEGPIEALKEIPRLHRLALQTVPSEFAGTARIVRSVDKGAENAPPFGFRTIRDFRLGE
jgi:hypothetical protein